jgi:hypothetical protein
VYFQTDNPTESSRPIRLPLSLIAVLPAVLPEPVYSDDVGGEGVDEDDGDIFLRALRGENDDDEDQGRDLPNT